jgi:uncharacterized membrane protein
MEKLIVVVFGDNEPKALEGLRVLHELDREGEISIYDAQMIVKTPNGPVRTIKNEDKVAVPLIAGGTAVGALIGLLGGPVGAAIGAAAGAVVGSIGDAEETGITDEFVYDVSLALTPGKVAMVADIDEGWVTPLDTRMEQIGGVVFRRVRTLVEHTQDDRDAAAHKAEMEELKAERQHARADRLAKIDARIDHLRAKMEAAIERKRAKMRAREQEREARVKALQAKANQSAGEIRRRQEDRIAAIRHEYAEKAAVK